MDFSQVREAADEAMLGQRVRLRGWLYRRHETDHHIDLVLRDGTGFMVCRFVRSGVSENTAVRAAGINRRSSIEVEGVINRDEDTQSGFRLEAVDLDLVDEAEDIDVSAGERDHFYRDIDELWKYPDRHRSISRVRSKILNSANEFFRRQEWTFVDPPIHVNEAREGGLFVDGGRVTDPTPFLEAQSYILGDVYTVYEGRDDRRLAAVSTWSDLADMNDLARDIISRVAINVAKGSHPELDTVGRDYKDIRTSVTEFETRGHEDALASVEAEELDTEAFQQLGERRETPLIVEGKEREADDIHLAGDETVETFSIVAPSGYGRLVEGFAFETETGAILDRFKQHGLEPDEYEWLMDLRREGVVAHAGLRVYPRTFTKWLVGARKEKNLMNFYHTFRKFRE